MGRRFLFACLAVAAALLLLEAGVRARQYHKYGTSGPSVFKHALDPTSGLRIPEPGSTVGAIGINSAGFRGPEIDLRALPGTVRLAFTGGSTTFCAEVSSNAATWPERVVLDLRAAFPEVAFDFINAGVPGYTARESLVNLRSRVLAYAPDVIVVYEGTNDFVHVSREVALERGLINPTEDRLDRVTQGWMTLYLLQKNLRHQRLQRVLAHGGGMELPPGAIATPFSRNLSALVDAARESAALTVVVTFATKVRPGQQGEESVAAASGAKYYMPFLDHAGLLAGYAEINQAIRSVAAERPDVLLVEGEEQIPADDAHFADTVHFRDQGAAAQAARVSAALCADPAFRALVEARSAGGHR